MPEQQIDGEACVRSIRRREMQVYDWANNVRRLGFWHPQRVLHLIGCGTVKDA